MGATEFLYRVKRSFYGTLANVADPDQLWQTAASASSLFAYKKSTNFLMKK